LAIGSDINLDTIYYCHTTRKIQFKLAEVLGLKIVLIMGSHRSYTYMDDDQKRAVDLAISGKSFFLTGAGGTGKSYVIRSIVEALNRSGRDVYVTAMTGCAALLLGKRAKTLHSWAGIGLGKESAEVQVRSRSRSKLRRIGCQLIPSLLMKLA